jgi:hypothetical protein
MEDIGGVALKTLIPKHGFDVDQFLDIACSIGMLMLYLLHNLPFLV